MKVLEVRIKGAFTRLGFDILIKISSEKDLFQSCDPDTFPK